MIHASHASEWGGWAQFETMAAGFTIATTLQAKSNVRIP